MRETRAQLIDRLTKQLANAHRRCDPADPATKDTIAASLVRVRRLVDRLADPLSDDETAAIESGTLELLARYPCQRRSLPDAAFGFAREQLWLARGLEPHLHALLFESL